MNKDVQRRTISNDLEEKGKIVEILNKDDYLDDELLDKTLYGEHVPTYHYWISPEKQKNRVNHIENITKNKEKG